MFQDKFIDPKEMNAKLQELVNDCKSIDNKLRLVLQEVKYIFTQIKDCESEELALEYFKLLDEIQGSLATITYVYGIIVDYRLTQFIRDSERFDIAQEYYFPKIRSGEYTI